MTAVTAWPTPRSTDTRPRSATRVCVQATDPLVRAGLRSELTGKPGIELLDDLTAAEVVVAIAEPALHDMPTTHTSRLVLIADQPRMVELWAAVERGLAVLVPREEATGMRLLRAVADARRGRGDVPPEQLGSLLRGLSRLHAETLAPRDLSLNGLTCREADVLRLLADGLDTGRIAQQLSYSERTVKNTLHSLLTRLGLHNRTHAVAYAIRLGLI
ncbi:helix-turn-helix transcriptional regulator [Actinophytocola xanthii]|uniref:Helix-turn-helix transcriptional regulator n=1 Tax=Actinophytocola xanthii TaxID=1912961 RepID=A0A1Q8CTC9_9PSEU|nr:response regulator transcription factor [Actinophytocola xanthii]OLF17618.1 helix-turn-helix transcriptional regulator [Actinophytocola xanthii]